MTATLAPAAFDVRGPLPTGTTVLEASAGTGKTFTIAALAARYVAEGLAELPQLMLVTFGREATQELRERVRERLVSAERALADPHAPRDEVDALLAVGTAAEVALRRARLARALAGFDAATIATTHQFCQQMLAGLGVAGDADADAEFVESIDDLVTEVVDDFYVRKYGDRSAGTPAFSRSDALTLARHAVHDGQARLEPATAEAGSTAGTRYRFASAVRAEVARRKRERRLYTYDDMLTRLDDALADPTRGAPERLRARYSVVLVDEFQDTDPVQWSILRRAFHGHTTLVLIGDPKQAIYAFRGADVVSYLDATEAAGGHATLATNYRTDAPLLRALDTVFNGAALGHDRIVVYPVESAHPGQRLRGAPVDTPFRLRVIPRATLPKPPRRDLAMVGPARQRVAGDAAADIAALLASPATIDGVPVRPGDVAVLVRTNGQGALIREALADAGVPAVLSGTASVFGTPVAREWLVLLEACEQPRLVRLRAAALTCFLGHSVEELCGPGSDDLLDRLGAAVRSWATAWHERGVAALLEAVTADTALPKRLLARTDGERLLTDLRHIAQSLHAAAVGGHLGPAALVDWLRHRLDESAVDVGTERSRRLESDAAAVQIITIHRSKGLEFPVVHVPFAWDRFVPDPSVPLLHDGPARVLDVGGETGEGWKERCAKHRAEEAGEDLRLLYVALTRAKCQVVTWWVPSTTTSSAPLHRLLIGRPMPGTEPDESYRIPADTAALDALRGLSSAVFAVEEVGSRPAPAFTPPHAGTTALEVAVFDREIDRQWRRTSYSGLTATAGHHGPTVASEPEAPGTEDEADVEVSPAPPAFDAVPSPMADLPLGTGFGTLVHAVFETADLTAPDLLAELTAHCTEQLVRNPVAGIDVAGLAAALLPAARTPLGPLTGGLRLADISPRDRLTELDFELPLAGGDEPVRAAVLGDLAPLLRRHLGPEDPLHAYPDSLESAALVAQPLRGYLTGSVDAVLRLPTGAFVVVDYKTNWLGPFAAEGREPLTSAHYTPDRLAEAMIGANYPLQSLLYGVALHRYLRWRLPGYDPAVNLGGSLYLFVRGMCGEATPVVDGTPCGVFGWSPPPMLTVELSNLLAGVRHDLHHLAARRSSSQHADGLRRHHTGCDVRDATATAAGPWGVHDPGDPSVAHSATGLLAEFNAAGVLSSSDVHVAIRLGHLGGEPAEQVLLAAALAVRAVRLGSVCVDLAAVSHTVLGDGDMVVDVSALPWPEPVAWLAAAVAGPLVAHGADAPAGRPLRLVDGLLYLERYWGEEEQVRRSLQERAAATPPVVDLPALRASLERHFPDEHSTRQRLAAAVGTLRRVTVLAGGPGTGKTTTVARLLAVLAEQPGPPPRIALAAPTGKAAARLQEAVQGELATPTISADLRVPEASTLHRLLGWRPGGRYRYDHTQRLPFDVVVVDETSMVSLTMMARLLDAVRPTSRLVLVGDPDQLASVEAGAVLGDLARAPGHIEPALETALTGLGLPSDVVNGVVTLDHVWRFGGAIAEFARAVQAGDADAAIALLRSGADDLTLDDPADLDPVRLDVVEAGHALTLAAREGRTEDALAALERHRVLCAHRRGPWGVARWTGEIERWLGSAAGAVGPWYPGRPVLVTANDYDTGLFNGDTGVVVERPEGLRVAFARGGPPTLYPPSRLAEVATVHAMTVHRGQGSQFRRVTVVLPPAESPLLTRELLYTAVTRAREFVRIIGTEDAVRAAVERPVARASGLRQRLAAR